MPTTQIQLLSACLFLDKGSNVTAQAIVDVLKSSTTDALAFQNANGTEIGKLCKAWVTFDGATGTKLASFNVSTVNRVGTGLYNITFTNAMPDTNYAPFGFSRNTGQTTRIIVCASSQLTTFSTTQIGITVGDYANGYDSTTVSFGVLR